MPTKHTNWCANLTDAEVLEMWAHFFQDGNIFFKRTKVTREARTAHMAWVSPETRRNLVAPDPEFLPYDVTGGTDDD
jgi:hypothetical protein